MENSTKILVNYFPPNYSKSMLFEIFAVFGPIRECKLITTKDSRNAAMYGFVDFFEPESARKAIENVNGIYMEKKQLKVTMAIPQGEYSKEGNLYVDNLPINWTEIDLKQMFAVYGEIDGCRILADKNTGRPLGKGFVRFHSKDEADAAIRGLRNKIPPGCTGSLYIERAHGGCTQQMASLGNGLWMM